MILREPTQYCLLTYLLSVYLQSFFQFTNIYSYFQRKTENLKYLKFVTEKIVYEL